MDERWAWVALSLAPGIGLNERRYHELLDLGSPAAVLRAPRAALAQRIGPDLAAKLVTFDARSAIEQRSRSSTTTPARSTGGASARRAIGR